MTILLGGSSAGPQPSAGAATLPPGSSCTTGAGASKPIHLTVTRGTSGPAVLVPVCVDGHGPYPFVLDTGASVSLVDSQLAAQLHLEHAKASQQVVGVGCVAATKRVSLASWSAGGLALTPQSVMTAHVPGFGLSPSPVGILGSDVLARFGAVRLDFTTQRLVVLGAEAPAAPQANVVHGGILDAPPPTLVTGAPKAAVSLTIIEFNGSALPTTSVVFGGKGASANQFAVSTGAGRSSIGAPLAKLLNLKPAGGPKVQSSGVGCTQRPAKRVASGLWNVGTSVPVSPASLVAFTPAAERGIYGTVGTDVLSRYGSVVLDYRDGVLWLGAG